eukprot:scaffold28010_cov19-Tisochrysis_lutea.AAC.1
MERRHIGSESRGSPLPEGEREADVGLIEIDTHELSIRTSPSPVDTCTPCWFSLVPGTFCSSQAALIG